MTVFSFFQMTHSPQVTIVASVPGSSHSGWCNNKVHIYIVYKYKQICIILLTSCFSSIVTRRQEVFLSQFSSIQQQPNRTPLIKSVFLLLHSEVSHSHFTDALCFTSKRTRYDTSSNAKSHKCWVWNVNSM